MYYNLVGDYFIYVVLYVDDILLIGNNKEIIKELYYEFDLKDIGATNFVLGMEIKRDQANNKL